MLKWNKKYSTECSQRIIIMQSDLTKQINASD